mmetsp:Transcript_10805/g.16426  ORF Transcript_10805/g.16426 Transcript_10805/m.16426 type:complete len:126 (+) Transcript_10805:1046-1423(+)
MSPEQNNLSGDRSFSPPPNPSQNKDVYHVLDESKPTQCHVTTEGMANDDYVQTQPGDRTAPGSSAPTSSMVHTVHQHIGDIRNENNFYIVNINNMVPQGKQAADQVSRGTRVSTKANPLSEMSKK